MTDWYHMYTAYFIKNKKPSKCSHQQYWSGQCDLLRKQWPRAQNAKGYISQTRQKSQYAYTARESYLFVFVISDLKPKPVSDQRVAVTMAHQWRFVILISVLGVLVGRNMKMT